MSGTAIGLAKSGDSGMTWSKYLSNPVLTRTTGGWDADWIETGSILFTQNELKLYYDGGGTATSNKGRVGLATSPFIPIPVELISFTAKSNGKEIILNWSTATELNNLGFEIQRSSEGNEFFTIGFVEGHGTTTEQQTYSYIDKNLGNGKNFYRLKQVDYDGSYEYSDVVEVEWRAFNSYLLEQNYRAVMTNLIGKNIEERNCYIGLELFQNEMQRGEFTLPKGYQLVPHLLAFKVVKRTEYIPAPDPKFTIRLPKEKNKYIQFIETTVGTMLTYRAAYELQFGYKERAKVYIEKAKKDFPGYQIPYEILRGME